MKYNILLLTLCCILSFNTASALLKSVEEHYWRDYRGLVPTDAVIGGKNKVGQNTYVGQMNIRVGCNAANIGIHTMDLIPATITHANQTAIGAYQGKPITSDWNSNVKVLCTKYSYRYVWHTEPSAVASGCRYVVAGQETLVPLYFGRAVYNNQTLIGKIFSAGLLSKTLFVPYEGVELALQDYATLMYCT